MTSSDPNMYQAIGWGFPAILPDAILASVPAESSTSYLRAAHRQHQIALQTVQKRTRIARNKLDDAQMKLKRLRREKEGLQGKRTRMTRQTIPLEGQVNEIDPAILQREVDMNAIEDFPPQDDPTFSHVSILAKLEQEIQAVQSRESSLQELGENLAALKSSITVIRHKSIIVDGALGDLEKVAQKIQDCMDDPALESPGSGTETKEDESSMPNMTTTLDGTS